MVAVGGREALRERLACEVEQLNRVDRDHFQPAAVWRYEQTSITVERDTADRRAVAGDLVHQLAGRRIPHLRRAVRGGGRDQTGGPIEIGGEHGSLVDVG